MKKHRTSLFAIKKNDAHRREAVLFQMVRQTVQTQRSTFSHTSRCKQQHTVHFPEHISFDPDQFAIPVKGITAEDRALVQAPAYAANAYDLEVLHLHFFVMFQELGLIERFKIEPEILHCFFLTCTASPSFVCFSSLIYVYREVLEGVAGGSTLLLNCHNPPAQGGAEHLATSTLCGCMLYVPMYADANEHI